MSGAEVRKHDQADERDSHSHSLNPDADRRPLTVALALIVSFMVAEVVVGLLAHSLALLSDAAHMLTDAGALLLSLIVIRLVQKPAQGDMTFGFKRAEIFSAQANGATLLVLALLIIYEGIHRLVSPPKPVGLAILIVALVGIVVNLAATWALSKANRQSMNVEGSFKHILTDLAAFIFTAIAAGVILATGFRRADGMAALVVAGIMLWAAYGLLRDSGRVSSKPRPRESTLRRSAEQSRDIHTFRASTISTSGRSAPTSLRSRLTSSSTLATTAMRSGAN